MQTMMAFLATALIVTTQPVAALECQYGTVSSDYWWHKARSETYVLVWGGFFDLGKSQADAVNPGNVEFGAEVEVWTATFKGFRASRRAFDQPFETEVTLVFPDFSFIGGGHNTAGDAERLPGKTGLVWLEQTEDGYRVISELCASVIDTNAENVKPALRCLRGGYCPKE